MKPRLLPAILTIALATAIAPAAALAEEGKAERFREVIDRTTPEGRAAFQTHRMKKELSLNQDQIDRVREINLKYARKVSDTMDASEGEFRKVEDVRKIGKEKDTEMKAVLSAEQYDRYLAMKEKMREQILDSAGG